MMRGYDHEGNCLREFSSCSSIFFRKSLLGLLVWYDWVMWLVANWLPSTFVLVVVVVVLYELVATVATGGWLTTLLVVDVAAQFGRMFIALVPEVCTTWGGTVTS